MRRVMLAASAAGARIFRNNQGIAHYPDGSSVKYGVANPGGSDLVGWVSRVITPGMVGRTVAVFVALEVKTPTGRATPAQAHFIDVVRAAGGLACVVRSPEEAVAAIADAD